MGQCGSGGTPPSAVGTDEDFFQLIPAPATVRAEVPDTTENVIQQTGQRRRVIASCEGRANQSVDADGTGVWISFSGFSHFDRPEGWVRSNITFRLRADAKWRDRTPVDLASFIDTRHATTALVIIDMDSGALLATRRGSATVLAHMTRVIRLAQAKNMPILEVYCRGNRTHDDLRAVIEHDSEGGPYDHRRVFEKPGTGGACDAACLDVGNADPFTAVISGFARAIVMGFDASICVGQSIFGGWRTNRQFQDLQGIQEQTLDEYYERGILDHGVRVVTSWTVCVAGSSNGPLPNGYLRYQDD